MENLKIKKIGVLREREHGNRNGNGIRHNGTVNNGANNSSSNNNAVGGGGDGGGGGVGDGGGGGGADGGGRGVDGVVDVETAATMAAIRQQQPHIPKMTALDLASILNCRRRLEWTKEWLKKNQTEFFSKENLRKEMQLRKNETYHLNCFFDITERQFRYLVTKLEPVISYYEPQRRKKSFSAEERIAITLKYLATGEFHSCRNYCFRASKPVILKMISDICLNMYELLKDQFLSLPKTDEQWMGVAKEMQRKCRLPNCIGNMTMRYIKFYATSRLEDEPNFTTKSPLIFTAITDSNNNFTYVDIEKSRARSQNDIYEQSNFKQLVENKTLELPLCSSTSSNEFNEGNNATATESCYFSGCGALSTKPYLLNSFFYVPNSKELSCSYMKAGTPQFEYCYAMDVANRHVENALCALSNIFPILASPLRMEEENARKIIFGCVILYNFLRKTDPAYYRQTERINHVKDKNNTLYNNTTISINLDNEPDVAGEADSRDDDDCILVVNDEEQRERDEYTPNVVQTTCFEQLPKQQGDSASGLAKRNALVQHFTKL